MSAWLLGIFAWTYQSGAECAKVKSERTLTYRAARIIIKSERTLTAARIIIKSERTLTAARIIIKKLTFYYCFI
jgi:hypothetical protein